MDPRIGKWMKPGTQLMGLLLPFRFPYSSSKPREKQDAHFTTLSNRKKGKLIPLLTITRLSPFLN